MADSLPQSRLHEILEAFQSQIRRIEDLERRIDERAVRCRRRITNLLDSQKSYRNSHLRVFVTHSYQAPPPLTLEQPQQYPGTWKLLIEGKLLIGHLDHASAAAYDAKTGYVAPTDDLDRSKGEKEEEEVGMVDFTHLFEKLAVQLQTIYLPKPNPMAAKKKKTPQSKKSRRSTSKSPAAVDEKEVDPRLLTVSNKTEILWMRNSTDDAHAFQLQYAAPVPPNHSLQVHSVVAKIYLYPNTASKDPIYQASPELAAALFPNHGPEPVDTGKSKKRKSNDQVVSEIPTPPLESEIDIPQGLTMTEITNAVFTYIQDRKLCDETDRSTIVCDKTLQTLFNVERVPFYQLQNILVSRNLIREISSEPVQVTYIMKEETATNFTGQGEEHAPSLLQLDMDIAVPSLFPYRARELLRRIKRRELEYTSSRTKARYLLMSRRAKEEEDVKQKIEQVVTGHQLDEDLLPIQLALAKSAPPRTEARMAAHLDARMSYLLGRLQERQAAAVAAWETVEACRRVTHQEGD